MEHDPTAIPPTSAVQAEALDVGKVAVPFRGDTYIVPLLDEWDLDTMEAFEQGRGVAMIRSLLGPRQWNRFKKAKPKKRDLDELGEKIAEAVGFESAGE